MAVTWIDTGHTGLHWKFLFDPDQRTLYAWIVDGDDGRPTHMEMLLNLDLLSADDEEIECFLDLAPAVVLGWGTATEVHPEPWGDEEEEVAVARALAEEAARRFGVR